MLCGQSIPASIEGPRPLLFIRPNRYRSKSKMLNLLLRGSLPISALTKPPHRQGFPLPLWIAVSATIRRWIAYSRQRQALREIAERNDHHLLKDIGVSQEEALREADKWFWRR
jgi:uncharacterized protein YjiS (DUF1127 family)